MLVWGIAMSENKLQINFEDYKLKFMHEALIEARVAFEKGEVPVGVVIVKDGAILARAHNKRNELKSAVLHAEIEAITEACRIVGDWRLEGCDIFVTLMPCPMCAGAIVNSRLSRVFYGADNQNKELFEKICTQSELNHKTEIFGDIMKTECSQILKSFFAERR